MWYADSFHWRLCCEILNLNLLVQQCWAACRLKVLPPDLFSHRLARTCLSLSCNAVLAYTAGYKQLSVLCCLDKERSHQAVGKSRFQVCTHLWTRNRSFNLLMRYVRTVLQITWWCNVMMIRKTLVTSSEIKYWWTIKFAVTRSVSECCNYINICWSTCIMGGRIGVSFLSSFLSTSNIAIYLLF
jgi:hypothetical protein